MAQTERDGGTQSSWTRILINGGRQGRKAVGMFEGEVTQGQGQIVRWRCSVAVL